MNTDKIRDLSLTIKSLTNARFYLVNGNGIISFLNSIELVDDKNAICYVPWSHEEGNDLINELNEAIKPVLHKYKEIAIEKIRKEVN